MSAMSLTLSLKSLTHCKTVYSDPLRAKAVFCSKYHTVNIVTMLAALEHKMVTCRSCTRTIHVIIVRNILPTNPNNSAKQLLQF